MALPYSKPYWFPDGTLAANVTARVFLENTNVLAPLWADAAETIPLANPLQTDGAGVLSFFASMGEYWVYIDSETFKIALPDIDLNEPQAISTGTATGVIYGGQMSGLGTNTVNFAAMNGYVVDYVTNPAQPTVTVVNMPAQSHVLAGVELTRTVNWWLCSSTGVITSQATRPTDAQRRTHIQLGVTGSTIGPGILFNVQSVPVILRQPHEQLADLYYGLGPFSTSGNLMAPNGANLFFSKSVGEMFAASFSYATTPQSPHRVVSPAETPVTFRNSTQLAGSQGPLTTTVDVANYDVGGVVTPVPGGANTATIQRVWLFGTGIAGAQIALQYGQSFYASLSAALDNVGAGTFVTNPDYVGIATLLGYIVSIKSATALNNPAQAVFVQAGKFAAP